MVYLQKNIRDFHFSTFVKYGSLKLPLKVGCRVFANYFFMG